VLHGLAGAEVGTGQPLQEAASLPTSGVCQMCQVRTVGDDDSFSGPVELVLHRDCSFRLPRTLVALASAHETSRS
jgi:hypothetical protein